MPPKFIFNTLTISLVCLLIFIPILTPFHLIQEHHWKTATEMWFCNPDCSNNTHHQNRIECHRFARKTSNVYILINPNTWNLFPENLVLFTKTGPSLKPLFLCINISRAPPSFL